MAVFKHYARYYDLLYRDKDYVRETEFVQRHLQRNGCRRGALLELGSGTGRHAIELAKRGWRVLGCDISAEMVAIANKRAAAQTKAVRTRVQFSVGDVRTLRTGEIFDGALALFHVASYQTNNADLTGLFTTVRQHLRRGGLFLFDVWYGPAVLSDPPVVRAKILEDDAIRIIRVAVPEMHAHRNVVDVKYRLVCIDRVTGDCSEVVETHQMRYLFDPEIEYFAGASDLKVVDRFEWMTGKLPDFSTWNVCFVLKA